MMRHRTPLLVVVSGGLAAMLLVTACGVRPSRTSDAHMVSDVSSTITIQKGVTFAPPSANAAPSMTAQQVYKDFMRHLGARRANWAIPANVEVQLGLFTLPVGLAANGRKLYVAHNVLAYGYSWHSCPVSRNPRVKKLPPNPCREWNFLDANTGAQIVQTWQILENSDTNDDSLDGLAGLAES